MVSSTLPTDFQQGRSDAGFPHLHCLGNNGLKRYFLLNPMVVRVEYEGFLYLRTSTRSFCEMGTSM